MKYIAFLRFKHTRLYQQISDRLPGDYIIEYHEFTNESKAQYDVKNGWEIETEEYFTNELAKNDELVNTFKRSMHDLSVEQKKQIKQAILEQLAADREEFKDYLDFKVWQKKMITQGYLKQIYKEHI